MTATDKILIEASKHYRLTEGGELKRVSTPYPQDGRTRMGLGFDYDNGNGYKCFSYSRLLDSKKFSLRSHRLAFYLHNGYLPKFIDHIDRNPMNNHPSNLRAATYSQNSRNRDSAKGSSSKFLGVSKHAISKKWEVKISNDGFNKYLGLFTNEIEAASHYNLAAMELHGEFANLNDLR
jgi:hypothetical protein